MNITLRIFYDTEVDGCYGDTTYSGKKGLKKSINMKTDKFWDTKVGYYIQLTITSLVLIPIIKFIWPPYNLKTAFILLPLINIVTMLIIKRKNKWI